MSLPVQPPRKVRVLHIDDSAVMRSLLRMVLEPHPSIEIAASASSGQEGLATFERMHPDLVLLDIEMPGINGLEVLSSIRRADRRVPVIMCSTLTGMGSDGLAGSRIIRSAGGVIFAQDAATSIVWGMPGSVANAGLASKILPLDAIPGEILRLVSTPAVHTRAETIAR
jgi:chemotaxis response regulator CheB